MVFYLPDADAWQRAVGRMKAAGFEPVTPGNDYWSERGVTFADPDGFRVVLENAASNF